MPIKKNLQFSVVGRNNFTFVVRFAISWPFESIFRRFACNEQVVVNIPLGECVINQWLRAAKNAKSLGFRIKLAFCARDNLALQQVCRA